MCLVFMPKLVFLPKMGGEVMNFINISKDETAEFANQPQKLSQNLIINCGEKVTKFVPSVMGKILQIFSFNYGKNIMKFVN